MTEFEITRSLSMIVCPHIVDDRQFSFKCTVGFVLFYRMVQRLLGTKLFSRYWKIAMLKPDEYRLNFGEVTAQTPTQTA
jgi:hypothetical protein